MCTDKGAKQFVDMMKADIDETARNIYEAIHNLKGDDIQERSEGIVVLFIRRLLNGSLCNNRH